MYECVKDNHWSYMDASKIHAATNYGSMPRLQLVVREPLFRSREPKELVEVVIEPAYEQYQFRFKFDNLISPWLNRMNQQRKLSDFATNNFNISFKIEKEHVGELKQLITDEYKLTVNAV